MTVKNLTPHVVRLNDGREFPPCGVVARIATTYTEIESVDGIPCVRTEFGQVRDLPEREDGVLLIVSGVLASALPERDDLIAPCTGHPLAVRKDGQVWSVPCFTRNNK